MNQSNCIVAQSGGPTVAINASLAGVIAEMCIRDSCKLIYRYFGPSRYYIRYLISPTTG